MEKLVKDDEVLDGDRAARPRLTWLDIARAFCILLVIFGHAFGGLRDAGLVPEGSILTSIWYAVYTFHMPAFFAMSGLLAAPSLAKNEKAFVKNAFVKIAYPYFLWSMIQVSVINAMGNLLNHPAPFDPFQFFKLFAGDVSQFWFLKSLFILHMLYFVSRRFFNDAVFLLAMIALRGCVELSPMPNIVLHVANFGVFYALGAFFSAGYLNWPTNCRHPLVWAAVAFAVWAAFAVMAHENNYPILADERLPAGLLPASIAGTLFIVLLSGAAFFQRMQPLLYIGKNTLPIFLLHVLFVAGTRIILVNEFHTVDVGVILPVILIAGLLGPIVFYEAAKRWKVNSILGM